MGMVCLPQRNQGGAAKRRGTFAEADTPCPLRVKTASNQPRTIKLQQAVRIPLHTNRLKKFMAIPLSLQMIRLPPPPILNRHAISIELHLHGLFNLDAVTTRHTKREWRAFLPGPVEHAAVSRLQAVVTELEAAQAVACKRVGTGQVQHQAGLEAPVKLVQSVLQRLQVRRVRAAVWQLDI